MGEAKRRKKLGIGPREARISPILERLRSGHPSEKSRLPESLPQWTPRGNAVNPDFGMCLIASGFTVAAFSHEGAFSSVAFSRKDALKEISCTFSCPQSPTGKACGTLQFRFVDGSVSAIAQKLASGGFVFIGYPDAGQACWAKDNGEWVVPIVIDPGSVWFGGADALEDWRLAEILAFARGAK